MKVMLDYFAYYGGNGNTKADPKGRRCLRSMEERDPLIGCRNNTAQSQGGLHSLTCKGCKDLQIPPAAYLKLSLFPCSKHSSIHVRCSPFNHPFHASLDGSALKIWRSYLVRFPAY